MRYRPDSENQMKRRSSVSVECSLIHSFLKGELLKSSVAHHHPLDTSPEFSITRSGIFHQLGSRPGGEGQTSPDDGGLILDPLIVRELDL
jgi:hypothetical protein